MSASGSYLRRTETAATEMDELIAYSESDCNDVKMTMREYCRRMLTTYRTWFIYTVSQKKGATLTMAITLSILDRFAKFFHCCKQQ